MDAESVQGIISLIIVIMIVVFIAKKAIKLAISVAIILFLFNVAFLWNGDTINEKLGLEKYLKPDAAISVTEFFNDFAQKRDEYGITVDAQEVYDKMTEAVKDGTTIIIKGMGELDIKKFADTIAQKIYQIGSENVDWEELEQEIKKQLEGIKQEDLDNIMNEIKEDVQSGNAEK